MSNTEHNTPRKAWIGILLVLLGAYFLLRNFHLIPSFIPHYFFGWEMIFIIIGGSMLATGKRGGVVFLGIGALFLIPEIFYLPRFEMRDWWPLILVIIGVSIFLRRKEDARRKLGDYDDDYFEDTSVFGGSEKSFTSQSFKGGRISAVFGGSEINFSDAQMGADDATIDLLCLFGGSEITVPNDWTVINESFVIFGGYSDSRPRSAMESNDPKKVLRIKGLVMFGGAEVKGA